MLTAPEQPPHRHRPLLPFAVLSSAALAATFALSTSRAAVFTPYFGDLPPLLVVLATALLGGLSLHILQVHHEFEIFDPKATLRGLGFAGVVTPFFAMVSITLDLTVGFPKDINVPWPAAGLFYPAIGYVVEVLFHALAMAIVLSTARVILRSEVQGRVLWACLAVVGSIEPIFQVSIAAGQPVWWAQALLALDLLGFNLVQMHVFRRYGFIAMFLFRVTFYLQWHILWGQLRLHWLF